MPDDTEQLFLGLLVQRGLAPRELVAECLDGASKAGGRSAMHLVVERARIPTDVARTLHNEAAAMARDGRGVDLARFLSSSSSGSAPSGAQAAVAAPPRFAGAPSGVGPAWTSGSMWPGQPSPPGSHVWAGNQADAPTPPSSAYRPTHAGPMGATHAGPTAWGAPTPGAQPAVGRTAATFEPGQVFGRYRLERELGRGGMGVVWRSRQIDLDRPVAIKMLLAGALGDDRRRARFLAEARAVARMSHPNVVGIFDVGEQDGVLFFTMELVDGPSLSELLKQGKVELRRALELGAGIADGLSYAHSLKLIHRDLKPANILIDPRGIPKITDFGIAKDLTSTEAHTVSGEVLGTPAYMPPEQANGRKDIDHRADVYALGAIVYRMVCAAPPFDGATAYDVIAKVLSTAPQPPSKLEPTCPQDVEDVILRCLAKDREKRYADASEVGEALRDARRTLDGPARGGRRRGGGGGSKTAVVVLAALLALVVAGGGVAWKVRSDAIAAEQAAAAERAEAERREVARVALEREAAARRDKAVALMRDALERSKTAPDDALAQGRKAGEAGHDSAEVQAGLGLLLRTVARDPRAASVAFARALELDAQRVDARAGRARCLLDLGRPATEVEAEADALDRLGPAGRTEAAELRADIALTRDELSVAIVHLDEAVKSATGSARLHLRLAQLLLRARRYASAEEEADAAQKLDPKLATAFAVRAAARKELGRTAEALKDADLALRLDAKEPLALQVARELRQRAQPTTPVQPRPNPTGSSGHDSHQELHVALAAATEALRRKDVVEAQRQWTAALEPADVPCVTVIEDRIQVGLALRQRELAQQLGQEIQRLSRFQGKRVDAMLFAADLYLLNGQEKDAEKALEQVVALDPKAWEPVHARAVWWEKHGDLVKARADFDRIGELAPTDGWAIHERSHFLMRREEFQAAVADLDKAISLLPDKLHLHATRGDAHYELGRRATSPAEAQAERGKAKADFERTIALQATNPPTREVEHARQRLAELR